MRNLELPNWLNKGEALKFANFLHSWWLLVEGWLVAVMDAIDPLSCSVLVLDLLAWQRNVRRFHNEPLHIYRLRVKHAFLNAKDAGSTAGLKRIFVRLGVGEVNIIERDPGRDWDVIILELTEEQRQQYADLLQLLLIEYGRTCRRYEYGATDEFSVGIAAHPINHVWYFDEATE